MNRPHTITVYNKYNDKYIKTILNNVYWYGTDSINISGKGIVESGAINIIIDGDNLSKYVPEEEYAGDKETFTIQKNTRIVYGEGPEIESVSKIEDLKQITVFSYDANIVGSNIDNILISGK